MSKTTLAAALVASVLLALPPAVQADSGHGHEPDATADEGDSEHGGQGASNAQPATLSEAWSALTSARDAIASDIESGALGEVHAKTEPLTELVAELVEQSDDLDSAKLARVKGAAKQVTRVADSLHVAADGGDSARTKKALSRLDGLLELIHAQYPDGALEAGGHGHGGHSAVSDPARGAHAHMERPAGAVDAVAQATIRVQAFDQLRFGPRRIEVQAGVATRIELENLGAIAHALVVKTPDGQGDWVHLHTPPGVTKAAIYRLNEPGTYPVLCTIPGHTEAGMIGELVVVAGRAPERS